MKVLVACEESQRVCTAFRERGHEAYSCDIQPCSGGHPEWHIIGDCIPILNGNCFIFTESGDFHVIPGEWDLLIAHPPCTYLSNAGACRLYPKAGVIDEDRKKKGDQRKEFFMRIYNAACKRICIENPLPSKIFELPPCSQIIQPYFFGDPYSKKTLLWLKNLPPLFSTDICGSFEPFVPSGTSKNAGQGKRNGVAKTARERSITFPGIARAMAEQWGNI